MLSKPKWLKWPKKKVEAPKEEKGKDWAKPEEEILAKKFSWTTRILKFTSGALFIFNVLFTVITLFSSFNDFSRAMTAVFALNSWAWVHVYKKLSDD